MHMALDQIMHELIALLIGRLTHKDEIKTAMAMLGELFDMMRHLGARWTLWQHAVLISLINQRDRAIRHEVRPIAKLLGRHLKHACFFVVEFTDVACKDHATLVFVFEQFFNCMQRLAMTRLPSEPIDHWFAPRLSATLLGTRNTFHVMRTVSAERTMDIAVPIPR
ncbi:hypothetical protein NY97_21775 [Xanthomonas citri pv. fuscans]|nr:hypothetical protein NY97_21775 [Xanthomonas citri pv. fuscans]